MSTQLCNAFIKNYLNEKNIGLTKFKKISKTKENGIGIRKFENSNKDYFLLSEINGFIKFRN